MGKDWDVEDKLVIHHCECCGNDTIFNCTAEETVSYEKDTLCSWPRSPQFIAFTTFKKLVSTGGVQLENDYKWHLMDVTELPGQEKELLGWGYFSQLRRKDTQPRNTKLNLNSRNSGYHFGEVCWRDVSEDTHIPAVLLFDHTLDIPIMWSFVDLTATTGGSITITQTEVVIGW
jgi:hypothetical protein